ncbi:MAG: hydantoinase B/oxoprolinase family protein, partial [Anaerolineales bacterium]|nr:hydantoinase B/oxoprolinase family protein [Anaerolineales bacterium]
MKKLNPVMLAVLKGRLEQIADEMDATLFRSAFNPVIAEAHDACHGLYDAQTGGTLAQGKSGLPIFVGSNAFAVRAVIDKIAQTTPPDEGDVYIFNDPYAGGTHLNDFRLIRPYFVEGQLFCFLASVGHWLDVGGNVPGNFNARAVESFQEGFMIPVVKLFRRGELQQDVVDIILANSRSPFSGYGDLYAQINALTLGKKRMDEMVAEYGAETLTAAFAQLKAHASEMMRKSIAELPDGVYRFEDYLDNDGINDRPLKIALDLTIEGETMVLDFSRTAPPCAGPLNIARSTAVSCCYVALKHLFPDVPANNGVMEPITFVIPENTLLNVSHPKAVGGYTETILREIDVIFG